MSEGENLEQILKAEAERINTGQEIRLREERAVAQPQLEKIPEAEKEKLISEAKTMVELMAALEDIKMKAADDKEQQWVDSVIRKIIPLVNLDPNDEKSGFKKALMDVPEIYGLREAASCVMPAFIDKKTGMQFRPFSDWVYVNPGIVPSLSEIENFPPKDWLMIVTEAQARNKIISRIKSIDINFNTAGAPVNSEVLIQKTAGVTQKALDISRKVRKEREAKESESPQI
ncbi:MAG: hypothetical protein NTW60_01660 [Candidatus Wolfebacteria bacterium]|nr:hypothetical protein [Candidatus Wolfebacteria bacterium]